MSIVHLNNVRYPKTEFASTEKACSMLMNITRKFPTVPLKGHYLTKYTAKAVEINWSIKPARC